jgi:hypothetical protein
MRPESCVTHLFQKRREHRGWSGIPAANGQFMVLLKRYSRILITAGSEIRRMFASHIVAGALPASLGLER